jgi:hypothetical protein
MVPELRESLAPVYKQITKMRHHVIKVYSCNDAGDDLFMFGRIEQTAENGVEMEKGFCARAVVDDSGSSNPRLKFFQGWAA